jgi:hypothetical protein
LEAGPWQIVWETLFRKKKSQKRAGGVAQGVGSEFILHYHTHTHTNEGKETSKCQKKHQGHIILFCLMKPLSVIGIKKFGKKDLLEFWIFEDILH